MSAKALHHHKAIGSALKSGDYSTAMQQTGHMMLAMRAAKGVSAPTGAPAGPTASQALGAAQAGSDDESAEMQPPQGIATPAPMPAKAHFFGQAGGTSTKKKKVAPAKQLSATSSTHAPISGGFNKARFASLRPK